MSLIDLTGVGDSEGTDTKDLSLIDDTADPVVLSGGYDEGEYDEDGYPEELRNEGLMKAE